MTYLLSRLRLRSFRTASRPICLICGTDWRAPVVAPRWAGACVHAGRGVPAPGRREAAGWPLGGGRGRGVDQLRGAGVARRGRGVLSLVVLSAPQDEVNPPRASRFDHAPSQVLHMGLEWAILLLVQQWGLCPPGRLPGEGAGAVWFTRDTRGCVTWRERRLFGLREWALVAAVVSRAPL